MTSHPFAVAIPFVVIAGLTWTIRGARAGEFSPIVMDVRFGDQALQVALLRILPIRRIPYADIAEATASPHERVHDHPSFTPSRSNRASDAFSAHSAP